MQGGIPSQRTPGPLATIVRRGDERSLDVYLLSLALVAGPPALVAANVAHWPTMLELPQQRPQHALRKTLRRLEEHRLIAVRKYLEFEVLKEDGSGQAYARPGSEPRVDPYVQLPFRYWLGQEQSHYRLPLAAKAMLLIALSHRDDFSLPFDRVPLWYGISRDTAQRGFQALRQAGLVSVEMGLKEAPRAPYGRTADFRYTLASWLRTARAGAA